MTKLMKAYPKISEAVELNLDDEEIGKVYMGKDGRKAMLAFLRDLADNAARQSMGIGGSGQADESATTKDETTRMCGHKTDATLLLRMKQFRVYHGWISRNPTTGTPGRRRTSVRLRPG